MKGNWWRLVGFLFLTFGMIVIWTIPLFLIYAGKIYDRHFIDTDFTYQFLSQMAMSGGAVSAAYIMVVKIESRLLSDYFLTVRIKPLLKGFLIGLLMIMIFAALASFFRVLDFQYQKITVSAAVSFAFYLFVAVGEEIIFRGYILNNLREKMSDLRALIISSILFGLVHYFNDYFTWIGFASISISGFLMGWVMLKYNSISSAIGMHWSWNFIQGPVLGFAVSGHEEFGVFTPMRLSSDVFTGGKFGAEGSLILAMMSCLSLFLFISRQKN